MPALTVTPSDSRLHYSGYVHLNFEAGRARFDRQYGSGSMSGYGPAAALNGGARISWTAAAEQTTVRLEYTRRCRVGCSVNLDHESCYRANDVGAGSKCGNPCAAELLVRGEPVHAPGLRLANGSYIGLLEFTLPPPTTSAEHDYTLMLPWGAAVDFRGLRLSSLADTPRILPPPPPPPSAAPVRYVAYGDSITQGFCSGGPSYPERLARLAGWTPVNMGIQGLAAASGAAWRHGAEVGAVVGREADPAARSLVTLLIGINDCFSHVVDGAGWPARGQGSTGEAVGRVVDQVRQAQPGVPIAVITPILTAGRFSLWRRSVGG